MRVVDRKGFLALPSGTIYSKGKPAYWDGITIKHDTITHDGVARDWCYLDPCWVRSNEGEDAICEMLRAYDDGLSRPMEDAISRDGGFDEDEVFLIFERPDLLVLHGMIDDALNLTNEEGQSDAM